MPTSTVSPGNSPNFEVTLSEVLAVRQSALGEADLWSVLYAACCSLQDYLDQDKTTWIHGPNLLVTSDSTMLSQRGGVTFTRGKMDPRNPGSFAPLEAQSHSRTHGRSGVEKIYVYSLGMTIYSSSELPNGKHVNLSEELDTLLLNMCEDTPEVRPSLAEIMDTCRKHTDGSRQHTVALVSEVLGSLTSSIHDMSLQREVAHLDSLDDASLQAEIDIALGKWPLSQYGSMSGVTQYSSASGRLPQGFVSPEVQGVFPAPISVPQPAPERQRRESGYASASLTNSAASNNLQRAPAAPAPVYPTVSKHGQHAAHLRAAGSTSSDDDDDEDACRALRSPAKTRKDSIDVARLHGTGMRHKRKTRPSPQTSVPAAPDGRQLQATLHETPAESSQPSIVPLSPGASKPTSPSASGAALTGDKVSASSNSDEAEPADSNPGSGLAGGGTSFSKVVAHEAMQRQHSRDPQKFAATLRRLESKGSTGATSHRVLDHIMDYEPSDEQEPNPALAHALLNSFMRTNDAPNSREVTGVFEGVDGEVLAAAAVAAETRDEPRTPSPATAATTMAVSPGAKPLVTDENEATQRSMQHKESLMMEKMYSLREAKQEARETVRRTKERSQSASSAGTDAIQKDVQLATVSEIKRASQTADTDGAAHSGMVRFEESPTPAPFDPSSPASDSDDVFGGERGFEPTCPKEYFERERVSSITKLKGFFGPDFSKLDGEERRQPLRPKPYHVAMRKHDRVMIYNATLPPHRRIVVVVLLNEQKLSVTVEVDSTGQELFDQVISHQAVKEPRYFGLAYLRNDEEIFLDLSCQLKKSAPKQWQRETQPAVFTVFFRVKFFVGRLAILSHSQTLHLYYLQLKDSLRQGRICCPEKEALQLAGLALQDQFGDLRSDMSRQKYFLPDDYLSSMVMSRLSNEELHNRLTSLHSSYTGFTHRQAQVNFVEKTSALQEYGMLFYRVRAFKKEDPPSMCLGIHLRGILLTMGMRNHERGKVNRYIWRGIGNLLYKKKRLTIVPRSVNGRDPQPRFDLWTDNHKMSSYLVQLCKEFHKFSILLRQPPPQASASPESSEKVPSSLSHTISRPASGQMDSAARDSSFGSVLPTSTQFSFPDITPPAVEEPVPGKSGTRRISRETSLSDIKLNAISGVPTDMLEPYTVTLVKKPGSGLGLVIVGGVDTSLQGVFVKKLVPDSPAAQCGAMQRGDRLLNVNGTRLEGLKKEEVVQTLLQSPPRCVLQMGRIQSSMLGASMFKSDNVLREADESFQPPHQEEQHEEEVEEDDEDAMSHQQHSTPHPDREKEAGLRPGSLDASAIQGSPASGAHIVQVNLDASSPGPMAGNKSVTSLLSGMGDYESMQLLTFTVALKKEDGSLGITITGGTDTPTQGGGVYIRGINPNGPTGKDGRLQIGDRLLSVDHRSVENVAHHNAFEILKDAPEIVKIKVERAIPRSPNMTSGVLPAPGDVYEVMLIKTGRGLGFTVLRDVSAPGSLIVIQSVLPGQAAALTGMISSGDYLLEVDGNSLNGLSQVHAVEMLRKTSGEVRLVLQRPDAESFAETPRPLSSAKKPVQPGAQVPVSAAAAETCEPSVVVTASPPRAQGELVLDERAMVPPESSVFTVVVDKKGHASLGLIIAKDTKHPNGLAPITILKVVPDTAAAQIGLIQRHDIILRVNDTSVEGISQAAATDVLKNAGSTVTLTLQRTGKAPTLPRSSGPTVETDGRVPGQYEDTLEEPAPGSPVRPPACKEPPEIASTGGRPVYSDFNSDHETDDDLDTSLSDSYAARLRWPAGERVTATVMKGTKGLGFLVHQEPGKCCYIRRILDGPVMDTGILKPKDFLVEVNGVSLIDLSKAEVTSVLKKVRNPITIAAVRPADAGFGTQSQDSDQFTPPVSLNRDDPSPLVDERAAAPAGSSSGETTPPVQRMRRLSPIPSSPPSSGGGRGDATRQSPLLARAGSPLLKPPSLEPSISVTSLSNDVILQYVPAPGQDAEADEKMEVLEIDLMKPPTGSLGLRLSGGADKEDVPDGVYVRDVVQGMIAGMDGRLSVNDRVLEVNGKSLAGLNHGRVLNMLRKATGRVNFRIARLKTLAQKVEHSSPASKSQVPDYRTDEEKSQSQRSSLSSKAVILYADELGTDGMLIVKSSSEELEATAAESSDGEFSDFDSNPIIDEDDIPPMPDTPELGSNVRTVLRRLSTDGDQLEAVQAKPSPSPLASAGSLLKPTSMLLTFSPSTPAVAATPPDGTPPAIPSSPPPPLPPDSPPSDFMDDEGPSLPLSLPPDDPISAHTGGVSPSLVPVDSSVYPPVAARGASLRSPHGHDHHDDDHHHHHGHHHSHHEEDEDTILNNTPLSPEEKLDALHSGKPTTRRVNKYCKSCNTPPSSPPLSRHASESGISPLALASPTLNRRATASPKTARKSPSSPSVVRRSAPTRQASSLVSPTSGDGSQSPSLQRKPLSPPPRGIEGSETGRTDAVTEPLTRSIAQELHNPAVSAISGRKGTERLSQNTFSTAAARARQLHPDPLSPTSPPSPKTQRRTTVPALSFSASPITRRASSPRGSPLLQHRQSMPTAQAMFAGSPLLDRPASWSTSVSPLPPGTLTVCSNGRYDGKSLEEICKRAMLQVNQGVPGNQFEELRRQLSPRTSNIGKSIQNKARNRYRNIIAYDETRVKLECWENDYINANHVEVNVGTGKANRYICTQAPKAETVSHFWCMIWQQNVSVIVMTTNLVESGVMKCHQYWPPGGQGDVRRVQWDDKHITVQLLSEEVAGGGDWMVRTLQLLDEQTWERRTVHQLHFVTWPDHGVPKDTVSMIQFVMQARKLRSASTGNMLVHCSAGVGRTGTFCVVDSLISRMLNDQMVDICAILQQLRQCRPLMVQTKDQLVFCYRAFIDILLSLMPENQE